MYRADARAPRAWMDTLAAVLVAGGYFLVLAFCYPHDAFSLSPDEGINAIKALLVDRGHRLYLDVWNDQPPLFTHLLRAWFTLFGWDIVRGRVLIMLFAALLVFAVYDLVRRCWGHVAALAGVLLLCSSMYFLVLSVSLMIGMPSIACAMLSLWALVRWRPADRWGWLLASALLMAVSLTIKVFTLFLVPLLAAWLVVVSALRRRPRAWAPALAWLFVVATVSAVLLVALVPRGGLQQLVAPHAAAEMVDSLASRHGFPVLLRIVPFDFPLVLLASLGTVVVLTRRCWDLALLPAWAAAAFALLCLHAPVWYHHYLLLSAVAGPMGGVAVAEIVRWPGAAAVHAGRTSWIVRGIGALAVLLLAVSLPTKYQLAARERLDTGERAEAALNAVRAFADGRTVVLTDAPMYAFRAGLEVVPELAVTSVKRVATGHLTSDDLLAGVARYAPDEVLLTDRFPPAASQALLDAMRDRYRLVLDSAGAPRIRLYVRDDIVMARARPAGEPTFAARPDTAW